MSALPAAPADVLAVRGGGIAGKVIRFGEFVMGKAGESGHVAVVTHQDQLGRWMGIQGQPGGVGPVDCTPLLADPWTRSNHGQPRDPAQTALFLAGCAKSLGIGYDWVGIAADAAECLHAPDLTAELESLYAWPTKSGLLPGHVVCSSLAAVLYDEVGWKHPDMGASRTCMPSDWWTWADEQQWEK